MESFLFSYRLRLRQPQNDEVVYPLILKIVSTDLIDPQIRKENARALKQIEDLGEDRIAETIRKRYPRFI
jgi:hypothetical protein